MLNDFAQLPRECAYCGSTDELTKEHVIPSSFEAENAPNWEPVIVWACKRCNNEKSRLDGRVRELFAIDLFGAEHDTAKKLLEGKIKRAVSRSLELGHKNHLLEFMKSMKPDRIINEEGEVIAAGMGGHLPDDPITPWFSYVVKGLSMALSGHRFVDRFEMQLNRHYHDSYDLIREQLNKIGAAEPVSLGTHTVFTYRPVDGAPTGFGVWVFQFYGDVVFVLFVVPDGFNWEAGHT